MSLIVIIHYHMHNSLVRIIRKRLILDWRMLMSIRTPTMENPEEALSAASKLPDDNSFFLNSLQSWEKLPDRVIGLIRDFTGGDGLSHSACRRFAFRHRRRY